MLELITSYLSMASIFFPEYQDPMLKADSDIAKQVVIRAGLWPMLSPPIPSLTPSDHFCFGRTSVSIILWSSKYSFMDAEAVVRASWKQLIPVICGIFSENGTLPLAAKNFLRQNNKFIRDRNVFVFSNGPGLYASLTQTLNDFDFREQTSVRFEAADPAVFYPVAGDMLTRARSFFMISQLTSNMLLGARERPYEKYLNNELYSSARGRSNLQMNYAFSHPDTLAAIYDPHSDEVYNLCNAKRALSSIVSSGKRSNLSFYALDPFNDPACVIADREAMFLLKINGERFVIHIPAMDPEEVRIITTAYMRPSAIISHKQVMALYEKVAV